MHLTEVFSVVRRSLNVVREVVAGWFHKGTGHRPAPAGGDAMPNT